MEVDDGRFRIRVCIQPRVKDADEALVTARVEVSEGETRLVSGRSAARGRTNAPSVWRESQLRWSICVSSHDELVGVLAHCERARVGARKREVEGGEQAAGKGGGFAGRAGRLDSVSGSCTSAVESPGSGRTGVRRVQALEASESQRGGDATFRFSQVVSLEGALQAGVRQRTTCSKAGEAAGDERRLSQTSSLRDLRNCPPSRCRVATTMQAWVHKQLRAYVNPDPRHAAITASSSSNTGLISPLANFLTSRAISASLSVAMIEYSDL